MTLGELYERYSLFLYRYKGFGITSHKATDHTLTIILRNEGTYEIPWDTEVTIQDDSFFMNGVQVRFCARMVELSPESIIQADMSGGYIPIDISNKKRTK